MTPSRRRPQVGFLRSVSVDRESIADPTVHPFSVPAIRHLDRLELSPSITFLIGENGAGKSTLLEAIAVAAGFDAEGGSRNFQYSTTSSRSPLHEHIRLARQPTRERDGFYLRAERFQSVATEIDRLAANDGEGFLQGYGGVSLHERSHGEAFMALALHRFRGEGLYLLDEPEAALSPQRQLALVVRLHQLIAGGSQFVIATHSPILLAFPGATIVLLEAAGLRTVSYVETDHFRLTRDFLAAPEEYLRQLL